MNAIWVFVEHTSGTVDRVTIELLGEARRLAKDTKSEVCAAVFGNRVSGLVETLTHNGADVIHVFEDDRLRYYDPGPVVESLGQLCIREEARIVLLPASTTGSDVAVRLAMQHNWSLVPRATNLNIRDGEVEIVRSIARDGIHAILRPAQSGPCLVTIAADLIGVDRADPKRTSRVVQEQLALPDATPISVGEFIANDPRTLDISEAEIVVSAGRGIGSKDNIRLVEDLADALGGSVGASRVVVDLGWLPKARQVGQTGKTVIPRLYVACGISGATAHTLGMKDASTIIAINTDAAAPIFKIAHLSLQADVTSLLPVLAEQCRQAMGRTPDAA